MVAIVKSGPDESGLHREAIHRLFFTAITSARSRLFITTPYFVPDRSIVVALQTAAARGIDVRARVCAEMQRGDIGAVATVEPLDRLESERGIARVRWEVRIDGNADIDELHRGSSAGPSIA